MFENLTGNEQAKDTLRRLISGGRLHGSLLFAGPEGVGKKQFAFAIARSVVCTAGAGQGTCDECSACIRANRFDLPTSEKKDDYQKVFLSEHPDVGLVVPYKRSILVDAIRDLEREANYRPFEAASRVFIIDDAHKMNDSASNALLKTLEEPASTTVIILVTSRPEAMLPTIRSRCRVVRFAPVPDEEIQSLLMARGVYADKKDAELCARLASGSIATALASDIDRFREMRELMLRAFESAVTRSGKAGLLDIAAEIGDAAKKDNFEVSLSILEGIIHDAWSAKMRPDNAFARNPDLVDRIIKVSQNVPPSRLALWIEQIEELRENLEVNINRRMATDALFVKMAA